MRNIKIIIEYDGKNFAGWQSQLDEESVEGELENAILEITGETVKIIGSGRTDAGVHALGQVANFHTNSNIPTEKIPYAINSKLKKSIVVKSAEEVEERFHARYNCTGKTYMYIVNNNEFPSALNRYREFHMPFKLNIDNMKKGLKYFEGTHDFKGFMSSGGNKRKTTVRTLTKCELFEQDGVIKIELTGNGFLYNMVRIICGTIVDIGLGKIDICELERIIESGDRTKSGKTLPPQGLYLKEVYY